ncbi:MAG: hypothetical protein HYX93_04495 [Chloroflexi bacterium]|nr:hypothetical protein [Chloroflexota bacterium]
MIALLFRLLFLPMKLVTLPLKLFRAFTTFVTCIVPLLMVIGVAAAIVWFLFVR